MPDLPELPNDRKTDLDSRWETLRDEFRLGDEELAVYDGARDAHAFGLAERTMPSIELAKSWFIHAGFYYWNYWRSNGDSKRATYARWLNALKDETLAKLATAWKGRSDVIDSWFEGDCRPAVEGVIRGLVDERIEYSYKQPLPLLAQDGSHKVGSVEASSISRRTADQATRLRRRSLLNQFKAARGLFTQADLARHTATSPTAIEGMVRGDRSRYSEARLAEFLKKISVSPEKW